MWGPIRRWKWPIAAVIFSILMNYFLYWTGPQPYQSYTFGIVPIILSYGLLALCSLILIAGIAYERNTRFRIYYICKNCNRNFIFEGYKRSNIRCPFCTSEDQRIAEIIALKENPRGIVWNPPNETGPSTKGKEFKICPMCGSLEDIANSICSRCSHDFRTELEGESSTTDKLHPIKIWERRLAMAPP